MPRAKNLNPKQLIEEKIPVHWHFFSSFGIVLLVFLFLGMLKTMSSNEINYKNLLKIFSDNIYKLHKKLKQILYNHKNRIQFKKV